jgi:predicted AlkP superfamily pyrophosphatase or phosphodiesterase
MVRQVVELDKACDPLLDAAESEGARVWLISEYGHVNVSLPVFPNRALRQAGLLSVRPGPFGEAPDLLACRTFAVCDHQMAHVYVNDPDDLPRARGILSDLKGVAHVLEGEERAALQLNHPRAGDLIAVAEPDSWFAYPFWLDNRLAPDYARTIDIHRKPGFDPCELFFDPKLWWPKGRAAWRLMQKKLGFRTLFDVIPLDANLVRGSHGLPAAAAPDRPLLIGDGNPPPERELMMTSVRDKILQALGLGEE